MIAGSLIGNFIIMVDLASTMESLRMESGKYKY